LSNLDNIIRAKFKEHWQEFIVDGFVIEELTVVAEVLSKEKAKSPLRLTGFFLGLNDVSHEWGSLFW